MSSRPGSHCKLNYPPPAQSANTSLGGTVITRILKLLLLAASHADNGGSEAGLGSTLATLYLLYKRCRRGIIIAVLPRGTQSRAFFVNLALQKKNKQKKHRAECCV